MNITEFLSCYDDMEVDQILEWNASHEEEQKRSDVADNLHLSEQQSMRSIDDWNRAEVAAATARETMQRYDCPALNQDIKTHMAQAKQQDIDPMQICTKKPTNQDNHNETQTTTRSIQLTKEEKALRALTEVGLTPLEIQRKRNRESVQRARKQERDRVEQMKITLQKLAHKFYGLSEAATTRRLQGICFTDEDEHLKRVTDYLRLAELSHCLQEENYLLEKILIEKEKTYRRVQQVLVDFDKDLKRLNFSTATFATSPLVSDFDYTPITEDQAADCIRESYRQMQILEGMAVPLWAIEGAEAFAPQDDGTASSTFGWDIICKTTHERHFFACFSKFFIGLTSNEAMQRSWSMSTQSNGKHMSFSRIVRCEVLQVINDSAFVNGIEMHHPTEKGKFIRTIELMFRLKTDRGFVLGHASLTPSRLPNQQTSLSKEKLSFDYINSSSWAEFVPQTYPETDGFMFKFYAHTKYNTQQDTYLRVLNALKAVLFWETVIIASPSSWNFLSSPPSPGTTIRPEEREKKDSEIVFTFYKNELQK